MEYFETGVEPIILSRKKRTEKHENSNKNDFLEEMKKNLENKTIFDITFSKADQDGNLELSAGGCLFHMKNADCVTCGNGSPYNTKHTLKFLERSYNVIVTSIDEEKGIIYVSHALASRILQKHIMRQIMKQIKINASSKPEQAEQKKKIVMQARIIDIDDEKRRVMVDISGYRINGIITSRQWGKGIGGTRMTEEAKVGDWIDVEVLCYQSDAVTIGGRSINAFVCSRRTLIEGNWNGLEERYKKEDIVTVICRKKLDDYSFMGEIPGEEGIPVLCVSSRKPGNEFKGSIIRGAYYQGRVLSVDENKKRFKMRFFKKIER